MRLSIEPPDRGQTDIGVERPGVHNARVLTVVVQPQQLGSWCWAAIAASLASYYGAQPWQQHEIATALLGLDCARFREEPALAVRCDQYARLDAALQLVGCYSHWSPGRPSFARLQAEIDRGRPLCLGLDWYAGGSHYVVVAGYHRADRELYLHDPLHGAALTALRDFPQRYRGRGGVWRGTFWTRPAER